MSSSRSDPKPAMRRPHDPSDHRPRSGAEGAVESDGWREHELSQLRYFRSLPLREKLEAVQGMADIVRRLRQMREEGALKPAVPVRAGKPAGAAGDIGPGQSSSSVHEPAPAYGRKKGRSDPPG
ncbi:MAG: hypothetical protein HYY13_04285 [Nitrospirae bacterium]|nr:hypothetical protein [Nitrospirota bacterium]